ncbi:MAG: helix-turn-helix transcriptional regulator [Proteobacteria bacterium]|nr:helix-turn-helix transcriptional regulator [Pseudomonadota bacterium]
MTRPASSPAANPAPSPVGSILKQWRGLRGLSQIDLAHNANTSARHLSFVETGRTRPSREMVQRFAEALDMPLRERNALLTAAGFAAVYRERPLDDDAMAQARRALELILKSHEPFPALVMSRTWDLLVANQAAGRLMAWLGAGNAPAGTPPNVLRLLLHPDGLRPFIVDWETAAASLISRARREEGPAGDGTMANLLDEVLRYPGVPHKWRAPDFDAEVLPLLPLTFEKDGVRSSWFTTIATFGTPQDITLQELRIESFFPADEETEAAARAQTEQD